MLPPRASALPSSVTMTSTSPPDGARVLAWAPASAGRQASVATRRKVTRFRNDMVERKTSGATIGQPRGCGGIGRRARFRSVWGRPRGGSSPLIRIIRLLKWRLLLTASMRLDLLIHGGPDAPLEGSPELRALVDPDRAQPSCDRELAPTKKPVGKNEDTRREERPELDLVLLV